MVAARRRGLTPGPWCEGGACWGWGVFAPVATGVVTLDGSSEVKMVALEGDMRYLEFKVPIKASLKPAHALV